MSSSPTPFQNHLKQRMAQGKTCLSMTVKLVRGVEIAQIAQVCGFDSLYIDLEHSTFTLDDTSQVCLAANLAGITPLVRVPANTPEYISRVLDGGAMGIIAPHVRSAADAQRVVLAAKFPPLGQRSAVGGLPHLAYQSIPAEQANPMLNEATLVVVMMETLEALERVEEIAAVDGIDMLLIGTNDLTAEMGIPGHYDDPRVQQAYQKTLDACNKFGKSVGVGGLASRADLIKKFVGLGCRYVSTGHDLGFLVAACRSKAEGIRSSLA